MAIEKVGIYPKWLEPVPKNKDGKPIPRSLWLKRRQHHWVVRWYSSNGQERYGKVFKDRKEAERFAAEKQRQVSLGRADRPPKVTLEEFRLEHERAMKGRVAFATLYNQLRALKLFENSIGSSTLLSRVTPTQAELFVAKRMASGVSLETVNKDIRTLRGIFNLREGQNPFARIKRRKVCQKPVNYVSVGEYLALESAAKNIWWKALISTAYGSGLRVGEILNLTWADIDFEHQQIHIVPKRETKETLDWEPKDREKRVAPMSDASVKFLAEMQAEAPGWPPLYFYPRCPAQVDSTATGR